ncbi:MAG TPA: IPT/TIG domain-containing protein, partial [Longimicrobiales bacterium]
MHVRIVQGVALFSLLLAACSGDGGGPTSPNPKDLVIAVQGGDKQIGTTGSALPKPLQVVVTNGAARTPAKGITVTWTATGAGTVNPPTSVTDSTGVASTTLTLSSSAGTVTVTATFSGNTGPTANFTAEATTGASITSVAPTSVRAGDTVTVTGTGFSTIAQNNVVLFDGVRGAVASASATQLRVIVPLCLPTRTVQVTVVLGPTTSGALPLLVTGVSGSGLNLAVGQASLISDAVTAGCITLPAGGNYLVAVENASTVTGTSMDFQLLGIGSGGASGSVATVQTRLAQVSGQPGDVQTQLDQHLRQVEAQLQRQGGGAAPAPRAEVNAASALPAVGDTGTFKVLNSLTVNTFSTVKAVVKLVTTHAIIYQDVNAPSGGFTTANFQQFGTLYDDPIYDTDTAV